MQRLFSILLPVGSRDLNICEGGAFLGTRLASLRRLLSLTSPFRKVTLSLLAVLVAFSPGGAAAQATGALSVTVRDAESGAAVPVRVHLANQKGVAAPLPEAASGVLYARSTAIGKAEGFGFQPDSSFYVDGSFDVDLRPGTYRLLLSKGNEYLAQEHQIDIEAGRELSKTYRLHRWIDMAERGWYSADEHIHLQRSPRDNPYIMDWIRAEGIHVGVLLWMGEFFRTHYGQYAWGEEGVYREDDFLLASGQEEPRTPEIGHTVNIGASAPVRFQDSYYLYDKVFDRIHELGGLTGYAHQAASFHGYRGLTLDALRGKVDNLELLQFCVPGGPLITEHYYHLLDLGYEVTATAGSDFPWCGRGERFGVEDAPENPTRIGNARFYTYIGGNLSYAAWKAGVEAGRTFVSSGPVVLIEVNGRRPGERLDVDEGTMLQIRAQAYGHAGQVPLDTLEIVGHGKVLARATAEEQGQSPDRLALNLELPVKRGLWIAARTNAGRLQTAHTTPVYVTVENGGFHNPETAARYLDLSEQYLQELEHVLQHQDPADEALDTQIWRYEDGLRERIAQTRSVIEKLQKRLED